MSEEGINNMPKQLCLTEFPKLAVPMYNMLLTLFFHLFLSISLLCLMHPPLTHPSLPFLPLSPILPLPPPSLSCSPCILPPCFSCMPSIHPSSLSLVFLSPPFAALSLGSCPTPSTLSTMSKVASILKHVQYR